jgi:hypothetical protein
VAALVEASAAGWTGTDAGELPAGH